VNEGTASQRPGPSEESVAHRDAGSNESPASGDGAVVAPSTRREHGRTDTKFNLVATVLIAIAVLLGFLIWHSLDKRGVASKYPVSWFIIAAAVLGAAVNQPSRDVNALGQISGRFAFVYIAWKCGVAIVFAFVLYFMAMGELIGGGLFPKFTSTHKPDEAWNMAKFMTEVSPESYQDIAKLLVWSFIAGYSERFVPNLIDHVVTASKDASAK
jgi:hypothetical protein